MHAAIVILSGGFDSVSLLHYVMLRHKTVRAVSFDYGQPHRDQELQAAQSIAEKRLAPGSWERIRVTDLGKLRVEPGHSASGVANAVVPGRNLLFLDYAANRAARTWPSAIATVFYGANADDGEGFADCRPEFVSKAHDCLRASFDGLLDLRVDAPWVRLGYTKARIAKWLVEQEKLGRPGALEDARASVSCYLGTRCGVCDACARRAQAFTVAGIADGLSVVSPMHGGDPQREIRS